MVLRPWYGSLALRFGEPDIALGDFTTRLGDGTWLADST